jgi:hypothetical protein
MGRRFCARTRMGFRLLVLAVGMSFVSPANAQADMWCWLFGSGCGGGSAHNQQNSPGRAAPEIDPNALASAIALAAGGAAVLRDRLRRRR